MAVDDTEKSSIASTSPMSRLPTSAPSSPPAPFEDDVDYDLLNDDEKALFNEEKKAQLENDEEEAIRIARHEKERKAKAASRKQGKSKKEQTREQTKQLEKLLEASALFSEKLKSKTEVLGKVGSSLDGNSLAQNGLKMAAQPECMVGGEMRGYQLEGLTWMYEVASHGMSGILADEMGLGKTIQTISLVSKFRDEGFYGPFLIIAPLSTLSNWQEEFQKWSPTIPVAFYHGLPQNRRDVLAREVLPHMNSGKPTKKFPIVLTTPEIIIRDVADLNKVTWDILIIDEGHRLKNSGSKLFKLLQTFKSYSRFLITGTPLQNNLKELWSLLHFLHPRYFSDWEMFESWFDFSEVDDEEGAKQFVQDKTKQALLKKMHVVLQPLLLRRIKADVEHLLPKKREYVLYAPMTKEQTDLYNAILDDKTDTRKYLEDQVVQRLTQKTITAADDKASPAAGSTDDSDSEDDIPLSKLVIRMQPLAKSQQLKESPPLNAFQTMMAGNSKKRKLNSLSTPASKSIKSSRSSTPALSVRGRKVRNTRYEEAEPSDEDDLSDDEFEAKLAEEAEDAQKDERLEWHGSNEEMERARILELARKEVANKKLGNNDMQLRLVCNSIHNFYNPWPTDSGLSVDSTLITSSGKMLLLDRLLPYLFKDGHKVLIFSQFKTQLDILEDYARELRGWNVCRIDGSVAQDIRRQQIYDFNNDPDYKLFLLSTRAGGQGINLATADTVILFDSDWNPQQDLQAQDRAHRIGQKNPVIIFRFATRGTVEESLLESANAKRRLEKLVIKKDGFKSLAQKFDNDEEMSGDAYNSVLLKDGEVYEYKSSKKLLTKEDLAALGDRSEEAYSRAEKGHDNTDKFEAFKTEMVGFMERDGEELPKKKGRGRPKKKL